MLHQPLPKLMVPSHLTKPVCVLVAWRQAPLSSRRCVYP